MATITNNTTHTFEDSTMLAIRKAMAEIGAENATIVNHPAGYQNDLFTAVDEFGFHLFTIYTEADEIY